MTQMNFYETDSQTWRTDSQTWRNRLTDMEEQTHRHGQTDSQTWRTDLWLQGEGERQRWSRNFGFADAN